MKTESGEHKQFFIKLIYYPVNHLQIYVMWLNVFRLKDIKNMKVSLSKADYERLELLGIIENHSKANNILKSSKFDNTRVGSLYNTTLSIYTENSPKSDHKNEFKDGRKKTGGSIFKKLTFKAKEQASKTYIDLYVGIKEASIDNEIGSENSNYEEEKKSFQKQPSHSIEFDTNKNPEYERINNNRHRTNYRGNIEPKTLNSIFSQNENFKTKIDQDIASQN